MAADGTSTIRSRVTDIIKHKAQGGRAWPSDIANRTARTPMVERWHGREDALQSAIEKNPSGFAETPAGEKAYLFSDATGFIQKEETAADFMARICSEATAHLRAASVRAD